MPEDDLEYYITFPSPIPKPGLVTSEILTG